MRSLFIFLFSCALLSACVHGPSLKSKTAYLDGENYSSTHSLGVIPLSARTKKRSSVISGDVQIKGITGLPARGVDVILRDKNQVILKKMRTGAKGKFEFQGQMIDGDYELEFKYKDRAQKRMVPLKGYRAKILTVYFD